jgi:serine/threonine protein kinase
MSKRLTEVQTCTMPVQVQCALVYFYAHGLVQCPLKAENISFCRADSDELKLIYFGLSKTILDTAAFLQSRTGMSY